jgi:ABC-2 type transport system permease protein
LPTWTYLVGRLLAAAVVAMLSTGVVMAVGVVFLHTHFQTAATSSLLVAFAMGLLASCAVGMAASGLIRSADAALPVSYAILLPVAFISQVFFPAPTETAWLHRLADLLPVAPFADAMQSAFARTPHGLTTDQFAVLLVWTVAGFATALLDYRWEPRREQLFRVPTFRGTRGPAAVPEDEP